MSGKTNNQPKTRERWLMDGMCYQCGKQPPAEGIKRCEECRERSNAARRKYRKNEYNGVPTRERRQSAGLCIRCGEQPPIEGLCCCSACGEQDRDRSKEWYKNNPDKRSRYYRERVSRKICTLCGANPADADRVLCYKCRFKSRAQRMDAGKSGPEDIQRLWESKEQVCPYLGWSITLNESELDHIFPKSQGGDDGIENLEWVHKDINRMKGRLLKSRFLFLIKCVYENLELSQWSPEN